MVSNVKPRSWIRLATVVTLGFCLGVAANLPMGTFDYDLGYHLATGRYVVETHTIPESDPFSFTQPTGIWPSHQWMSALLLYVVFWMGGYPFLVMVKWLFATAIILIMLRIGTGAQANAGESGEGSQLFWPTLCALSASFVMADRFLLRPELFSLLLFAIFVALLQRGKPGHSWYLRLGVLSLPLVWAHLHAGMLVGVLLVFLWGCGAFWEGTLKRDPAAGQLLLLLILGSLIGFFSVGAVNPGGLYGLLEPIWNWQSPFYRSHVLEFRPPSWKHHPLFYLTCVLTLAWMLLARKHLRWRMTLPTLGFMVLSLRVQRLIPYYAILLPWVWISIRTWQGQRFFPWNPRPVFIGLVWIALIQFGVGWIINKGNAWDGDRSLLTLDRSVVPVSALHFARAAGLKGRVFNEDAWGGWITFHLYPETRVFVDNRLPVYGEQFYKDPYLRLLQALPGWMPVLNSYGPHWVILRTQVGEGGLQDALLGSGTWLLIYLDSEAMIFVSREQVTEEFAHRFGLPFLQRWLAEPHHTLSPAEGRSVQREIHARQGWGGSPILLNIAGVLSVKLGEGEIAESLFAGAVAKDPCYPQGLFNLARFEQSHNREGEALRIYRQVISCGIRSQEAFFAIGASFRKRGYVLRTQRLQRFALQAGHDLKF